MSEQRQQRARDTELAELGQEVGTLVTWSPHTVQCPAHGHDTLQMVTTHCPGVHAGGGHLGAAELGEAAGGVLLLPGPRGWAPAGHTPQHQGADGAVPGPGGHQVTITHQPETNANIISNTHLT